MPLDFVPMQIQLVYKDKTVKAAISKSNERRAKPPELLEDHLLPSILESKNEALRIGPGHDCLDSEECTKLQISKGRQVWYEPTREDAGRTHNKIQ